VRHTAHGQTVLEHFLFDIAGLEPTWTTANVVEEQVERIREQVGDGRRTVRAVRRRRLRRSPRRWCSGPSVTGSPASTSTTG
jgi:hypothetical protein